MRTLARTTLASLSLFACGDNGDMQITQTNPTSLDTGNASSTGDATSNVSDPGTTGTPTTGPVTTGPVTTTEEATSDPLTTGPTTGPTTDAATDASTDPTTETTTDASSSGGETMSLMETYGHACESDADCKALLGADGVCQKDILGVYNLPGGYCTTYCQLPDQQTSYQLKSEFCTMMADCVGLMGFFEACAYVCTDNSQCPRDGYECRVMPQISNPGDPKFCLMTEDNMIPP